jgi:hypothetical protein
MEYRPAMQPRIGDGSSAAIGQQAKNAFPFRLRDLPIIKHNKLKVGIGQAVREKCPANNGLPEMAMALAQQAPVQPYGIFILAKRQFHGHMSEVFKP